MEKRAKPWSGGEHSKWVAGDGEGGSRSGKLAHIVLEGRSGKWTKDGRYSIDLHS